MESREKKNKRIGYAVSVGLHALLILLFIYLVAWKAPDPPLPEYGIELNFGMTDAGAGDVQPVSQEPVEEVIEESQPEEEVVEEAPEEVIEEPVEEVVEEVVSEQPTQAESPHYVEPEPEPVVEKKPPAKEIKTEPEKKPEPKINKDALYPGGNSNSKTNQETSQGDKNRSGDQGAEDGKIDSRSLYGKQGGGDGGPLINLSNWAWDKINITKDPSSENGKIVFRINVDDGGYITGISVVETTVSPSVVRYYQSQVEKFTFTFNPSSPGASPAAQSTGTITLFIRQQ